MAANIWVDERNRAHLFVGRNQEAWHKLGKVVDGCLTWQEAIEAAGLNWNVQKEQLFDVYGQAVPSYGMFRETDRAYLGTVGERYTIIQNRDAFEWVDALIGQEGAHYDTAGALGDGEVVFCSAHLPSAGIEPVPGDKYQSYLLFKTSHDGSMAAICKLTSVRVVCQNTLNMALQHNGDKGGALSIRHTKSSAERLERAKRLVFAGKRTALALQDRMVELSERQVTRRSLEGILKTLFPQEEGGEISTRTKNNIEDILRIFEWNDGGMFPETKGTAYALVNAVTEYTDKLRSSKLDRRAESAIFGSGEAFKDKAFGAIYQASKEMPHRGRPVQLAVMDRPEAQTLSSQVEGGGKRNFLSSIAWPKSLTQ